VNSAQIRKFRASAHNLNPVVMIGQAGLTQAVLAELEIALDVHELIKVKVRAEKPERLEISEKMCAETGAQLIQSIGQVVVLYRKNPNKVS